MQRFTGSTMLASVARVFKYGHRHSRRLAKRDHKGAPCSVGVSCVGTRGCVNVLDTRDELTEVVVCLEQGETPVRLSVKDFFQIPCAVLHHKVDLFFLGLVQNLKKKKGVAQVMKGWHRGRPWISLCRLQESKWQVCSLAMKGWHRGRPWISLCRLQESKWQVCSLAMKGWHRGRP
jgi:hypothetical protein